MSKPSKLIVVIAQRLCANESWPEYIPDARDILAAMRDDPEAMGEMVDRACRKYHADLDWSSYPDRHFLRSEMEAAIRAALAEGDTND